MSENSSDTEWMQVDKYGRREVLQGAVIGEYSIPTNITATLPFDFEFKGFNANSTLNHSSTDPRQTLGPTGVWGGEGHFGLYIVGDANIENCNGSSACCDNYNSSTGLSSCTAQYACSAIGAVNPTYTNGIGDRVVPNNGPGGEKSVSLYENLLGSAPGILPLLPCGPALRLTTNRQHLTGSAWYSRPQEIRGRV